MENNIFSKAIDVSRISFILGVHSDFNDIDNDSKKKNYLYNTDSIANLILEYMDNHRELEDMSMTLTPIKGLYRLEYGCPPTGENLYKLTSLYNPLYGQSKEKWRDSVIAYAQALGEFFFQSSTTIIIENYDKDHPIQVIHIKNENESRKML